MSTAEALLHSLRQQTKTGHTHSDEPDSLPSLYLRIRQQSLTLCQELEIEDFELQADDFVSPIKWHLAHTSWFFETFILKNISDYRIFHPQFEYLFNSYYNAVGKQYPRNKRGIMSRPTVSEVKSYRQYIDQKILALFDSDDELIDEYKELIILGLNHEQQHQELMLTDRLIRYTLFMPKQNFLKVTNLIANKLIVLCHWSLLNLAVAFIILVRKVMDSVLIMKRPDIKH